MDLTSEHVIPRIAERKITTREWLRFPKLKYRIVDDRTRQYNSVGVELGQWEIEGRYPDRITITPLVSVPVASVESTALGTPYTSSYYHENTPEYQACVAGTEGPCSFLFAAGREWLVQTILGRVRWPAMRTVEKLVADSFVIGRPITLSVHVRDHHTPYPMIV